MKIAHLISNYFPNMGGAQVCVHHIANRIVGEGHETAVLTPARGGRDDNFFKYEILRLNPLLNRLLFTNFSLGKLYLENILERIQKKYNFDVWQVTVGYPLGAASADFFIRRKIPCVLRCAGEDIQMLPGFAYGYRLNKKIDRLARENYRKFKAFVALSSGMRADYISMGIPDDKISDIPNGVDCSRFEEAVDRKAIRNELGVKADQKLIITVGRNHPKKGFKYIPQIIQILCKKGIDFKWLLVGKDSRQIKSLVEGENAGQYVITREINAGVSNRGGVEIPHDDLIKYYKAADIFTFPTFIETFGNVVIEAMAAGLPVVTTDAPGVDDIVVNNKSGLKNKTGDIEGLAQSIFEVLSNKELSQRLGANALAEAKNYDWERITGMYLDLYEKLRVKG